jgi:hypothetical protein
MPDLLVADSGSNDVRLLRGIGNGTFDDQNPTIYPVGTNPSLLYIGNFTGGSGQELATINSGSNSVTLISGLGTASPVTQTFSSGGIDPTAGLVVDLQGNGHDSLVVANNADGNIALFTPGENGLVYSSVSLRTNGATTDPRFTPEENGNVFSSVLSSGLSNPSAMVLAGTKGTDLDIYATSNGEDSATLLSFQLEGTGAGIPVSTPTSSPESTGSTSSSAQLLSLNGSSLALIGTLLTVTLQTQHESEQTSEGLAAQAAATGSGPSAGQSLVEPNLVSDETSAIDESSGQPIPTTSSWARYVSGVDQALERIRSEADQRLLEEREPARVDDLSPTLLYQDQDAREHGSTASLVRDASEAGGGPIANPIRLQALDGALNLLGSAAPASREPLRSAGLEALGSRGIAAIRPAAGLPTVREFALPARRSVELEDRARPSPALDDDRSRLVANPVSRLAALMAISASAAIHRLRSSSERVLIQSRGGRDRRPSGGKPVHRT